MLLNVKGIEIELGKHYPDFNEKELSVLPPKSWKSDNDKARFIWVDENGELYWEFDLDS